MPKKVIISLDSGSVEIATMDLNWKMKQIADSSKPKITDFETALEEYRLVVDPSGMRSRITNTSNLPTDRTFRDAWTDDLPGDQIDVDMPKARIIHEDLIRRMRDKKWDDFDKRYVEAERDSKPMSDLKAERSVLKDIPQNAQPAIDAATTPDILKEIMPIELL